MAIIAYWNKNTIAGFAILLCLSVGAQPTDKQENPFEKIELGGNDQLKFDELFFQAEKQKNLGNLSEAEVLFKELYALNTTNATVCFELAQIYLVAENPSDAVYYAEHAYKIDKQNYWFAILLASAYRAAGESKKEVKIYEALIENDPTKENLYFELSNAHINAGDLKKAIKALGRTEAIIGINENVARQKKFIYLELGDVQGAVSEMDKLIRAYPDNLDYYGTLAKLYEANGFEKEAMEVYRKMLAIDPSDPRPNLDLALHYRDKKEITTSLVYLKRAMASPNLDIDRKIPVLLSLFDVASKDSIMAMEVDSIFASVLEASPQSPKAFAIYGDFLSKQNRAPESLKAYKTAIRLEGGERFQIWEQILLIQIQTQQYDSLVVYGPQAVELFPNQPLPYFFTGAAFNAIKQPKKALTYLEDGLAFTLGNASLKEQYYLQLAEAFYQVKEYDQSDTYFDRALALNPNSAATLNNYAYYLSVRKEKLDKALEMTVKSNALSPKNATFLDTWAWVLYQKKDFTEALTIMEKALALEAIPNPELLEHHGDILFELNQKDKAKMQWQKALDMGGEKEGLNKRLKKVS